MLEMHRRPEDLLEIKVTEEAKNDYYNWCMDKFRKGFNPMEIVRYNHGNCGKTVIRNYYSIYCRNKGRPIDWRLQIKQIMIDDEYYKRMPIEGYDNYLLSNNGKLWSLRNWCFVKPFKDNRGGYLFYSIHNSNDTKKGINIKHPLTIHRLVMATFGPPGPPCPQYLIDNNDVSIDHINHDIIDNRIENLRWMSKKENGSNQYKDKLIIGESDEYIFYKDNLEICEREMNKQINTNEYNNTINHIFRQGDYVHPLYEVHDKYNYSIHLITTMVSLFLAYVSDNTCASIDDIGKNKDLSGYTAWKDAI